MHGCGFILLCVLVLKEKKRVTQGTTRLLLGVAKAVDQTTTGGPQSDKTIIKGELYLLCVVFVCVFVV